MEKASWSAASLSHHTTASDIFDNHDSLSDTPLDHNLKLISLGNLTAEFVVKCKIYYLAKIGVIWDFAPTSCHVSYQWRHIFSGINGYNSIFAINFFPIFLELFTVRSLGYKVTNPHTAVEPSRIRKRPWGAPRNVTCRITCRRVLHYWRPYKRWNNAFCYPTSSLPLSHYQSSPTFAQSPRAIAHLTICRSQDHPSIRQWGNFACRTKSASGNHLSWACWPRFHLNNAWGVRMSSYRFYHHIFMPLRQVWILLFLCNLARRSSRRFKSRCQG